MMLDFPHEPLHRRRASIWASIVSAGGHCGTVVNVVVAGAARLENIYRHSCVCWQRCGL